MALQKQNVAINFSGGMDTKTDPKQVVSGKLLLLENGIYQSLKRIKKKNGYLAYPRDIEGQDITTLYPVNPQLESAINFGILAGTTVNNTGITTITANLGVSPGTTITGSPRVEGQIFVDASPTGIQAQVDLTNAYNYVASQPVDTVLTGGNLGGMTLTPGVYFFAGSAPLTGTLTLDGNGIYIFQIGTTLVTDPGSSVNTINGASPNDVYWQVGGASATIGTNADFRGNILAMNNIVVGVNSTIEGRLLSRNGSVTLNANYIISAPSLLPTNPITSFITEGAALANYKKELVLLSGEKAFSFSDNTQRWTDKGKVNNMAIEAKSVIRNTYQQTTCDSAFHPATKLQLFTWEDSRGGSRYSIIDSTTNNVLISDQNIGANAQKPKALVLGNFFVILFFDSILNNLRMISIPVVDVNSPNPVSSIALDINTSFPTYDATCDGVRIFVAYNNSSAGISVVYINKFLSTSAPTAITGETAPSCISVAVDPLYNQVWVSYHNGTQIKYFIHAYSLNVAPILAPTLVEANSNTINNITMIVSNQQGDLYYTQNAAATYNNFIRKAHLTSLGVVTGLGVFLRSVGIASKLFAFGGIIYILVAFESMLQPTYFVVNTSNAKIEGKISTDVGGGLLEKNIIPEVTYIGNNKFLVATLQKDLFTTISGAIYTQTGVIANNVDFSIAPAFTKVELGENLHFTGGILHMYDGVIVTEHNFNIFPENVTSSTATGAGSIAAGTYQYAVVYEWMDNQGQIHYSAPSVPVTQVTTTATSTNTLTIPTLRLTNKTNVTIGVYRTQANGTVFTKITSITSPLLNNPLVDTVSYIDTASDASILGNPELYTTGGVIENTAAPAPNFVTTFKDRIILLPSENTNQWWYSKQVVPGVPVEFTDSFVKNVDQAGGALVGAARLDSVLVLLKETRLYYVTGVGPDSTGAQDDYSEPNAIACDGGCVDKKSIILTPTGLMYKSQKGIYLLNRNMEVSYIGADVEAYNSDSITSVTLIADTTQVRFCLSSGKVLVYDYFVNQWSVFTKYNAIDAIIFQNKFTHLNANGYAFQETPGICHDNGNFINLKLITSWLSLANLEAFQRVYTFLLLGEYITPHNLRVSISYDFNPAAFQETVVQAGGLLSSPAYGNDAFYGDTSPYGGAYPGYNFKIELSRQKCTSIQMTLEDTQTGLVTGESLSLSAMGLEIGVKKGMDKLPASRSFG